MAAFKPDLLTGDAPALRELLARESAATVAWLEALGVALVGPYPEPPHRVSRMHNVVPSSRAYIARLLEAAHRLKVELLLSTDVAELVRDASGTVTGAVLRTPAGEVTVEASRGVILACGDFSGNPAMRHEHLSPTAAAAHPINPHANGDGHRLAATVGAAWRRMDVTFGPQLRFAPPRRPGLVSRLPTWRWLCRAEAFLVQRLPASALRPFVKSLLITHTSPAATLFAHGAILVNNAGERFCAEKESVAALSSQDGGRGFIVFDARIAAEFNRPPNAISTAPGIAFAYFDDYRRGRPDLVFQDETAAALAGRIGVDPAALAESVRQGGLGAPLVALGPVHSMLTVTEGALAVDDELRVLDAAGAAIPGLHAVGGLGQGGMLLLGHGHHIAWAMTSGRLAGRALATSGDRRAA